jgi:hypothetical protein
MLKKKNKSVFDDVPDQVSQNSFRNYHGSADKEDKNLMMTLDC